MARKRMVSPEVFTSAVVASWPASTRWTWVGLLCYLDDYGYGEDAPALVKAAVWPRDGAYTERKVGADMDRIVAVGSLCRFVCCGKPQVHAPTWERWQKVAHPGPARFCPCPAHSRAAHELHAKESCAAPRSVVELSRDEGSSSGVPSDLTPEGSDGLAAAKEFIGKLRQPKNPRGGTTNVA